MDRRHFQLAALAAASGVFAGCIEVRAEAARAVPPYAGPEPAATGTSETAVFAGGCFWGVQGVFQHVQGVTQAVSGYAGGKAETAHYRQVGTGTTGHAEAVQISFDPRRVSYARLLQIHFSVVHDPTQLNRQGPDTGPEYRSAIFPLDAGQQRIAEAYVAQLERAKVFPAKVVTTIEPGRPFYPAEDYHQDFLLRNPTHGYIVANDVPKVQALKRLFPEAWRDEPVRVSALSRS
jgi:peptide-methionine (S)-S-oxide reductase